MKFTRIKSEAQARHVGSRSASHKRDKAHGDARRELMFVAVEAATRPSPERTFPGAKGIEAIRNPETGRWRVCSDPNELGDYLVKESANRARFQALTSRHGHPELMTRQDPSPLKVHVTSWHPAVSQMLSDLLVRGDGRELHKDIFAKWASRVPAEFGDQRYTLACALHLDCGDGHIDTVVTRNGPKGRLGKAGLGLVGPWCVAVDRQLRCGAVVSSLKRAKFDRSMTNFHRREGADSTPFDIRLARLMDKISDEVLGAAVNPYVDRYVQSVPAMERAHTLAALREVDAARDKLVRDLESIPQATSLRIPILRPPQLAPDAERGHE